MSRQAYEFGFWAIIIVAAGTGLLMYQHATHTAFLVNMINGMGLGSNAPAPSQVVAADQMAGDGQMPSPATGVWTPNGPTENISPFYYNPPQRLQ